MIVKELTITNSNGDSITFGRHFRLINGLDLSGLTADVSYSESTRDGASYQNTTLSTREFDLSFFIYNDYREKWWIEERRRELFKVFNPKHNPMKVEFVTKAGEPYYLNANLGLTPSLPQGFENDNNVWQKGLLQFSCDDPFIYAATSKTVDIAMWVSSLEFPLEIVEGGIELGYRSPSLIVNAFNDGDETGMLIRFKALSHVSKPSLVNVNSYQTFALDMDLLPGDVVEVSTYIGKKTVTLIRNNVRTSVFNNVTLPSTFLQLEPGDNLFRYDADAGLDFLEVSMTFTPRMVGV